MKTKRRIFFVAAAITVGLVAIYGTQGADPASSKPSAAISKSLWQDANAAKERYLGLLLEITKNPGASGADKNAAWKSLAREGYIPAYEYAAEGLKEQEPGASVFWASFIKSAVVEHETIHELLKSKDPKVRLAGILLGKMTENRRVLEEAVESEEDRANQRYLWIARARLGDVELIKSIAGIAGNQETSESDRMAARMSLGAYLGLNIPLTPEEFRDRLIKLAAEIVPPKRSMATTTTTQTK